MDLESRDGGSGHRNPSHLAALRTRVECLRLDAGERPPQFRKIFSIRQTLRTITIVRGVPVYADFYLPH